MAMTVLSIAFPFAPVAGETAGGAEQILSALDQALCADGHQSLVLAHAGSCVAGELLAVPAPLGILDESAKDTVRRDVQAMLDRVTSTRPVDLIHMHGLDFGSYTLPPDIPVLVTLHMPIGWYEPRYWSRLGPRVQFCCVSQAQRRTARPEMRNVCVIENGVPLPPLAAHTVKGEYAVVMGRICPEKNAAAALQAGTRARTRVLLAGQVFSYREHLDYMQQTIEPMLAQARGGLEHALLGPLGALERHQLLCQARCLLHPTLAPETSSLVAMEALAAGTPVIAYRSGALPEIVDDGVTGLLVDDVEEMAAAIARADQLAPAACRLAAERRFSRERMVAEYLKLYRAILRPDGPCHG